MIVPGIAKMPTHASDVAIVSLQRQADPRRERGHHQDAAADAEQARERARGDADDARAATSSSCSSASRPRSSVARRRERGAVRGEPDERGGRDHQHVAVAGHRARTGASPRPTRARRTPTVHEHDAAADEVARGCSGTSPRSTTAGSTAASSRWPGACVAPSARIAGRRDRPRRRCRTCPTGCR